MLEFPDDVPPCPRCQRSLRFVSSVRSNQRAHVGSDEPELDIILLSLASKGVTIEIFTFECAVCGLIYLSGPLPGDGEGRDGDSLVGAPQRPAPTSDQSTAAVPEPDDDSATSRSRATDAPATDVGTRPFLDKSIKVLSGSSVLKVLRGF
jgi:hypothetical protein